MKPTIDEDTLLMFNFEKDFDQDYFLSYYYGTMASTTRC